MSVDREADEIVVRTKELTKLFGAEAAVQDLTLEIERGLIVGLIGPSGSGKTTTVRLLTGVYRPTSGVALVFGRRPTDFSQDVRARIGYMLQHSVLYKNLTVWENLNFASSIYGVLPPRSARLREVLDFVELTEHKRKAVRNLSGGMQRRLSLAATLVHEPELLFLDEPTAGIDPVLRRKFWEQFHKLRDEGRTLLVTTQYVGEATYCDVVAILEGGRLLFMDTPRGLRRRAFGGDAVEIRAAYPLSAMALEQLWALAPVRDVIAIDETTVRLIVGEATTAIPLLLTWLRDQATPVESIQEYLPPFDEVFVTLIENRQAKVHAT